MATIQGPKYMVIKALDIMSLSGAGDVSTCATSSGLKYTWVVTNSTGGTVAIKVATMDPRAYVAPAYSFKVGSSYTVTLMVTSLSVTSAEKASSGYASVALYVEHGLVKAAVRGGYNKQASIDKALTLDASISSDEDVKDSQLSLKFLWTCIIVSINNFGSACNFINPGDSTASVYVLPAYEMTLSTTYAFQVVVSSADGRTATQTVRVETQLKGAPDVYSSNSRTKFNANEKVINLYPSCPC